MTSGAAKRPGLAEAQGERPGLAEAQGERPGREEFLIWGVEKSAPWKRRAGRSAPNEKNS